MNVAREFVALSEGEVEPLLLLVADVDAVIEALPDGLLEGKEERDGVIVFVLHADVEAVTLGEEEGLELSDAEGVETPLALLYGDTLDRAVKVPEDDVEPVVVRERELMPERVVEGVDDPVNVVEGDLEMETEAVGLPVILDESEDDTD